MTDAISRQAAIDALGELATFTADWSYNTWMYTDDVYNAIKQLPPIQPEIVRCKDCKHRDPEDKKCDCGHDIQWQLPRRDDWFCADGER